MEQKEFEKKAEHAMAGPASFERLWTMMEESESETLQLKIFKNDGDQKPFRAVILVSGEEAVGEVLKYIDSRNKD